jgi:hypothetical protein
MADYVILRPYRGDHYAVIRTPFSSVPPGQIPTEAWLTLKVDLDDAAEVPTIQKHITPVAQAGIGQIIEAGGVYSLQFLFTPTDTRLLPAGKTFEYDIQVLTSIGQIGTGERGAMMSRPEVTLVP